MAPSTHLGGEISKARSVLAPRMTEKEDEVFSVELRDWREGGREPQLEEACLGRI